MLLLCYALNGKELWNVSMRRKHVYVSLSMLNVYETCFVKNEENKWRLCLEVFLMNEVGRGIWGLIGGENRVHGTFLLDSQPLVDFFLLILKYEVLNPLFHTMVKLGN